MKLKTTQSRQETAGPVGLRLTGGNQVLHRHNSPTASLGLYLFLLDSSGKSDLTQAMGFPRSPGQLPQLGYPQEGECFVNSQEI